MSSFDDLIKGIEEEVREEERRIFTGEAHNSKNNGEISNPDSEARINGNRITGCKFLVDGCGVITACESVITEIAKGKTTEESSKISYNDVLAVLDLPPGYIHCAKLAADTLRAALNDYRYRKADRDDPFTL